MKRPLTSQPPRRRLRLDLDTEREARERFYQSALVGAFLGAGLVLLLRAVL